MSAPLKTREELRHVRDALNATIDEFQRSPYAFLYERDIQARLHSHLWSRLAPTAKLETSEAFERRFNGSRTFSSHPVRTEWPVQVGQGRLDIALLAADQWNPASLPWNQRAWCAIELKLWSDPKGAPYVAGLNEDFLKLQAYFEDAQDETDVGVAVLFVHPHKDEETRVLGSLLEGTPTRMTNVTTPIDLQAGISAYIVTSHDGPFGPSVFQLNPALLT